MRRRWLFWLLIAIFVWVVATRFAEIEKLAQTLAQGQWQWVLAAVLLQVIYYVIFTGLYRSAFDAVEVTSRVRDLLPVVFSSLFVNLVAPSGGASGAALFVDEVGQRGQSRARAAAGTLLVQVADFSSFALVLFAGMIYLLSQHDLQSYEVVAAVVLLIITVGMAGVLLLGLWRPHHLRRLLAWFQQTVNRLVIRLRRPVPFAEDWAERNAAEFRDAAVAITAHPGRLARTLGVGLAAHVVDLTSIYVLFRAFGETVEIGVLVAGFAIGVLFWIVAITPQGVGVVEGAMALVYSSLGVPAATATVVALAFRGLTFWLPVALGFFFLRRVGLFGTAQPVPGRSAFGPLRDWRVRVVALLTGVMGVVNVLSAVTPTLSDRLHVLRQILPLEVRHGGHLTAALAGFALLLLSRSLWRRKRVAWFLTLGVLILSAVSHLVKGLDYEESVLALALAAWLWALRSDFRAKSDPPSVWQGVQALGAALLFTLAYGMVGFYLLDRHFSEHFGFGAALSQTVIMFTQFYDPGLQPITGFGRYFANSIYMVGAATTGYALLMMSRPVLVRGPASAAERIRARAIVEAHGRSALARLTLFDDKSYYFSPGGSLVAYVVKSRIALALGDPIGPDEDAADAIRGFKDFCSDNDWQPTFYQTMSYWLAYYRAAGFNMLCIGHEGIVDVAGFDLVGGLSGGANKKLRLIVNRFTKGGFHAVLHEPPLADSLMRELRSVSDAWLAMMHGMEKSFSLGGFDDDYIRNAAVMAIHRPDGAITAFANIQPEYRANEATIDLMRRRLDAEDFTMEFLFLSLFDWARRQGYATFNRGLSSLAGVGEKVDDPAVERALHYIYEHVNQFYNFKGLHEFKDKFHPRWEPRFLVYPGPSTLPAVALALIRADSGDDFAAEYLKDLVSRTFKSE